LNRYLDSLLDRAAQKLAPRVADQLVPQMREEYESWLATIETMTDPQLVSDLREADSEGDEDSQDYEEIRRELGLAETSAQDRS
jgi:hypothetical protein